MSGLLEHLLNAPTWAVLSVVGVVVFVEDALFVGFVVPGETVAVLGGVPASQGQVPWWAVMLVVVSAAIVGDSVGYEVGRHFGPRLVALRMLANHRDRIASAQEFLARRGGMAVFLGRWVAFFRAVMPALSGLARMPYRRFLPYNAAGGIVWGVTVVLVGYLAGASYPRIERLVGRGTAVGLVVLAAIAFAWWRLHKRRQPVAPPT